MHKSVTNLLFIFSAAEPRMEDSDQSGIVGDQLGVLDAGQKLSEFQNRPPGENQQYYNCKCVPFAHF